MRRVFLSLILVLCWAAVVWAGTNYYIDPSSSFTISAKSGKLQPFEWITQSNGAQAIYCFTNGCSVTVCAVLGSPSTGVWTGVYSGNTVTASTTPSPNGSDSNTGTQSSPWQTCQHATASPRTGNQAGTTFYIRAQTVCYNDTFLFNCYGAAGNYVTLTSYVDNAGDGTLNPRIYAAKCLPTGTGSVGNIWSQTTSPAKFPEVYQASQSMLRPTGYSAGIWWDDWYHASTYPGMPPGVVGSGVYSGQFLEQYVKNPNPVYWYTGNNNPLQTSESGGLNPSSPPTLNAGGSGYPAGSTFNIYVVQDTLSTFAGQIRVTTNSSGVVTKINGVVQDGSTGGYIKGNNYSTGSGVATYSPSGGSGCTVNIASGNLTTVALGDALAMVDTYSRTLYYDTTNHVIYIHNPMAPGNPANTAGTNIWVPQYQHAIGIEGAGISYIIVNGVDGYYAPICIGMDNNQTAFASNYIVENCNSAFETCETDMVGTSGQWINCNTSYYGYAGSCPFDAWGTNTGYQTDQITITQCSDNYPLITSQFGEPPGLLLDFYRNAAYGLTWGTPTGYTISVAAPPGAGPPSGKSTITSASCRGSASVTSSNITTVLGYTYTTLFNLNQTSGQAPTLSMTGATINRGGGTLAPGWNTVNWTATASSASFTISNSAAASFSLTPRASHQVKVNIYTLNNPNGSKTGTQDYYSAIFTNFSSNSTLSNIIYRGQGVKAGLWVDKYSLNITMSNGAGIRRLLDGHQR